MAEVSVSNKGQIVIPARLREKYGIRPGSCISLVEREQELVLKSLSKESVRQACGMLVSRTSATKQLLAERAKDKRRENAKAHPRRAR
jgi:AbrB family looped-hinge helix DNA binding protein